MKARTFALIIFLCIGTGTLAAQHPAPSIPFKIDPQIKLIMIDATAGSEPSQPFVLDTGGGITVLAQSLVDKLGGKPAGQFTGFRLTAERLDVQLFVIPSLRVGPITQTNVLVGGWDGLDKLHIAGIIALSFFRKQPFTLDFQHSQLIFETPATLAKRQAYGDIVPIHVDDDREVSLDLFAPVEIGSHPAECEVDTGSQGFIFSTRYMKTLGLTPDSPGIEKHDYETILGGKKSRYIGPLPDLHLGGTQGITIPATKGLYEDIIYDCNIGMDFWANRIVTFDAPSKQLIIAHPQPPTK